MDTHTSAARGTARKIPTSARFRWSQLNNIGARRAAKPTAHTTLCAALILIIRQRARNATRGARRPACVAHHTEAHTLASRTSSMAHQRDRDRDARAHTLRAQNYTHTHMRARLGS